MGTTIVFEQSIQINTSAACVEQCLTDRDLMHCWLNPLLRCDPIGDWSTELGSQCRFIIQIPLLVPTLESVVIERAPGLIVWGFEGFFRGRDRWECQPQSQNPHQNSHQNPHQNPQNGTRLLNRFEFEIPNPLVRFGFQTFAAQWTQQDMQAQLQRLKQVAEGL